MSFSLVPRPASYSTSYAASATTARRHWLKFVAASALLAASWSAFAQAPVTLLNVSYDPTRELYVEFNAAFTKHWKAKTGQEVAINSLGFRDAEWPPPERAADTLR